MSSSSSNVPPPFNATAPTESVIPEQSTPTDDIITVQTKHSTNGNGGSGSRSTPKTLNVMVVDDTSLFRRIMADALSSTANVTVLAKASNGTECLEQLAHLNGGNAKASIDAVFLDVEMPVMNGLETLRVIRNKYPDVLVVMVSGHNKTNVDITIEALALGAYDFIGKPEGASGEASQEQLRKELFVLVRSILWQKAQEKLRARQQALGKAQSTRISSVSTEFPSNTVLDDAYPLGGGVPTNKPLNPSLTSTRSFEVVGLRGGGANNSKQQPVADSKTDRTNERANTTHHDTTNDTTPKHFSTPAQAIAKTPLRHSNTTINTTKMDYNPTTVTQQNQRNAKQANNSAQTNKLKRLAVPPPLVLIGISTGGPAALMSFLPKLPANLGLPILIVQHMPPKFTRSLADSLDAACTLTVKEATHNERLQPNVVYIAPGGFHMEVESAGAGQLMVTLNQQPLVNSCRPSVDVLFKSAAQICLAPPLSVIMTGMGKDGCDGIQHLKNTRVGTYCITQTESSCVVYGMPKAVDTLQLNDESVPLEALANRICELLGKHLPTTR
jgi:two-component system chemotaxis response regulator CheB